MPRARFLIAIVASLLLVLPTTAYGHGRSHEVRAEPIRALDVGNGIKQWVFVHPHHRDGHGGPGGGGGGGGGGDQCTDPGQNTAVPTFAKAAGHLTFKVAAGTIPTDLNTSGTLTALQQSFEVWDDATGEEIVTVENSGGNTSPAQDGTNSVGWAFLVPPRALAAAWVWTDSDGRIVEADVFFNNHHDWGLLTSCGGSEFDVQNVGAHEGGHVFGLDHLQDSGKAATMYPSAPSGEILKRTLTNGDVAGLQAALS